MLHIVVTSVCIISGFHVVLGLISIVVGVVSSIKAEIWLAHSVSPIWSGGFFFITGVLGIFCARRKTSYVIMCFTAFSVVSMVTAVVSIQLLRLGLVNHTTDGHTFQKQNKDILIIVALALAGSEILVCLLSILLSCRIAKVAKEELCKRREGMFHVKGGSDVNDNDVSLSPREEESQDVNTIDTVEIHVVDENGVQIEESREETNTAEIIDCLENRTNNESEISLGECACEVSSNNQEESSPNKHALADKINESSRQNKNVKEIKSKHLMKKSKAKDFKKPMQIFTVLEEEISNLDDVETPRT